REIPCVLAGWRTGLNESLCRGDEPSRERLGVRGTLELSGGAYVEIHRRRQCGRDQDLRRLWARYRRPDARLVPGQTMRNAPAAALAGTYAALECVCNAASNDLTVDDVFTTTFDRDLGIARTPPELQGHPALRKIFHEPGDLRGACRLTP